MRSFNVLDGQEEIHRHYLLEASAGTGKTFAIEHIVVRLLTEEPAIPLEKILVVTFTRAAARDLRMRIRANIERALTCVVAWLKGDRFSVGIPDYLVKQCEKSEQHPIRIKRALEYALMTFDQAQMMTIHAFCARMLRENVFEGDLAVDAIEGEMSLTKVDLQLIVRDFFRTGLSENQFRPAEIKVILKEYGPSVEELQDSLLNTITKGIEIAAVPNLYDNFTSFCAAIQQLKREHRLTTNGIVANFMALAPSYKGICNKQRQIKPEILDQVEKFAAIFDKEDTSWEDYDFCLKDQLSLVKLLDEKNLGAKAIHDSSSMTNAIKESLQHLLSPHVLFARMAFQCRALFEKKIEAEEKYGFNELLKRMHTAVRNPSFAKKISPRFAAVLVDEFQDTDPLQWEIFRDLFIIDPKWTGYLYLVGDPKQSIYAFRQADIYTYLSAAQLVGEDNQASLDTNYRAQPSLVNAMNLLFSAKNSPGLISLPFLKTHLPYRDVKFSPNASEKTFSDSLKSFHFFIVEDAESKSFPLEVWEERFLFPFMVQEIQRLHLKDSIKLSQCAILVADRFQATRVADFLDKWGVNCAMQRSASLAESNVLPAMRELLQAVLRPRNESVLRVALGGILLGWTHDQIIELDTNEELYEKVMIQFLELQKVWREEGFPVFLPALLQTSWHADNKSLVEHLLVQNNGDEKYNDLLQIADALLEYESSLHASPDRIVAYLDKFSEMEINDDPLIKKRNDTTREAVQILTLHSSKGLEFEIVFPIGLIKRSKMPEQLIPHQEEGIRKLVAISDSQDERYQHYCEEVDAEKMRQLYVALTRAKYRIYCPAIIAPLSLNVKLGCASPMELFLSQLDQPHSFHSFLTEHSTDLSYTNLEENITLTEMPGKSGCDLLSPSSVLIPGSNKIIQSFTSLSRKHVEHVYEGEAPHNFERHEKNIHTLPSGAETGVLLHTILEEVPIQMMSKITHPAELIPFVRSYVFNTPYSTWEEVISEMVYNAFRTPLNSNFCLAEINPTRTVREIEFLYPTNDGLLKGVVDLLFEYQGKYYIVDWKTNWLGMNSESYSTLQLEKAMEENSYFLQASLYEEATRRYIQNFEENDFSELFGGVYYLFLRGMHPQDNARSGIYHFYPIGAKL